MDNRKLTEKLIAENYDHVYELINDYKRDLAALNPTSPEAATRLTDHYTDAFHAIDASLHFAEVLDYVRTFNPLDHSIRINAAQILEYLLYTDETNRWNYFTTLNERCVLTLDAINKGLRFAWLTSKRINTDYAMECFASCVDMQLIMSRKELKRFAELPDRLTLYRGCSKAEYERSIEGSDSLGISWTSSREVAERYAFAEGAENRVVLQIKATKSFVAAMFFHDAAEEFIIPFPNYFTPKIVAEQPTI